MIKLNILLTSVGRRSYLVKYFKKAIGTNGLVHVANSSNISPAFQVADMSVVTPLIYDYNYIPFILQYCQNNKIDAVISLFDIDLPVLAKNRSQFDEIGVRLIVSSYDIVKTCNDKWLTYKFLTDNGFNVPKTFIDLNTLQNAIETECVSYPLIIKPRWGMGSIGVYQADNNDELKVFYNKVLKEIKKSYLKYESVQSIESSVLIQEKINGIEYGLDIINDLNSKYINTVVKRKFAMRSGETDCAVTENNVDLKNLGEKLSRCTKHIANMDVDVFVVDSKIYVLEMNARFGGGYPFSHMAGVNLPLAIIEWIKYGKCDDELLKEKPGIMSHKDINLVYLDNRYDV